MVNVIYCYGMNTYVCLLFLYLQPTKYEKMEKADILDLTVQYMNKVSRGGSPSAVPVSRPMATPAVTMAAPIATHHHMPAHQSLHPAMAGAQPTLMVVPPVERFQNQHVYGPTPVNFQAEERVVVREERLSMPPSPPMTPPMTPPASPDFSPASSPMSSPASPLLTPPVSPAKSTGRSSPSLAHLPPKMRVKNMAAVWRPF